MEKAASSSPSLARCLASLVYELLLIFALFFVVTTLYTLMVKTHFTLMTRLGLQLSLLFSLVSYFVGFWSYSGQTLPMKTWCIKVVDKTGAPLTIPQATRRFILAFLGFACMGVSILWAIFDQDSRFLHDRLAGTKLINSWK
jgi:uncharacterized RDD family membrane protein YckC